jgi:hypothetical protein
MFTQVISLINRYDKYVRDSKKETITQRELNSFLKTVNREITENTLVNGLMTDKAKKAQFIRNQVLNAVEIHELNIIA